MGRYRRNLAARKGISSAIVAIVLLPVIFGVLAYGIYSLRTQYVTYSNLLANQEYRALSNKESLDGILYKEQDKIVLTVENHGLSTSIIKFILVKATFSSQSNLTFIINLTNTRFSTVNPISGINVTGNVTTRGLVVPPGGSAEISIEFSEDITSVTAGGLTVYGTYIPFKPQEKTAASIITGTFISFTIPSLTDLQNNSQVEVLNSSETLAPASPQDPGDGMTLASGYSGLWCLYEEVNNATLYGWTEYNDEGIGFSSKPASSEGRYYNLFFTSDLDNFYSDMDIYNSSVYPVNIGDLTQYPAVRVIVYGYQGYIQVNGIDNDNNQANVLGIKLYGQYNNETDKYNAGRLLYLNGKADKVFIYVRTSQCGYQTRVSYTPYLIIGDFDNNGYPELLFITEDGYFDYYGYDGYKNSVSSHSYRSPDLDDVSDMPLTFLFKGYPLDSNKYIAVQVTLKYYFHDNVGGDEDALDVDNWILRVGLYDPVNKSFTPYYSLRYQYLSKMEDTYPPAWDYRIDVFQIIIPQTGRTYYLALQFQDPYGEVTELVKSGRLTYYAIVGGDIMVGIEYLSMVFMQST